MVTFFMPKLNVEIKAKCTNPDGVRQWLLTHQADFIGTDFQTDTYFNVARGRLKLREGNIENNLIFYLRDNQPGPKNSQFQLVTVLNPSELKTVLEESCGIKMIVKKKREIYYIENVKFHIDEVPELGWFVEIEAGNTLADKTETELREQCNFYLREFDINEKDLVAVSYSDMLLQKEESTG